jgi:hypothetical protein
MFVRREPKAQALCVQRHYSWPLMQVHMVGCHCVHCGDEADYTGHVDTKTQRGCCKDEGIRTRLVKLMVMCLNMVMLQVKSED